MADAKQISIDHDGKITDECGHVCGMITFPDDAKGILGRALVTGSWVNKDDLSRRQRKSLSDY